MSYPFDERFYLESIATSDGGRFIKKVIDHCFIYVSGTLIMGLLKAGRNAFFRDLLSPSEAGRGEVITLQQI